MILFILLGFHLFYSGFCCLPLGGFNPAFPGVNYGPFAPRPGPYRSEGHSHAANSYDDHSHGVHHQRDQILTVSTLNCANFAENCKWANTNDEELDWSTLQAVQGPDRYLSTLGVDAYPDPAAGALISNARPGWEGGQLISDPLPCIPPGIRITATAWRTRSNPEADQPKLQVCSKSVNEVKLPLVNCNEFGIVNGVPVTVDVPPPSDHHKPAQIVFYGNNFVSPQGGAIFLQEIFLQGNLECNENANINAHPVLIEGNAVQGLDETSLHEATYYKKSQDTSRPLKIMEGLSSLEAFVGSSPVADKTQKKPSIVVDLNGMDGGNTMDNFPSEVGGALISAPPVAAHSSEELEQIALYESCLALSCNPSDLNCKFWRSSGSNRWEIGTPGRVANPLTGVRLTPGHAQKFLVAPFLHSHIKKYTLVSESLTIPSTENIYFCFDEYFATQGLSLSLCTEETDCFYEKTSMVLGNQINESKKWNTRCVKLKSGTYELRVIAENLGTNKGEVGFLPVRLTRDPSGQNKVC